MEVFDQNVYSGCLKRWGCSKLLALAGAEVVCFSRWWWWDHQGRGDWNLQHRVLFVWSALYGVQPNPWNVDVGWEAGRSFPYTCTSLWLPCPRSYWHEILYRLCLYTGTSWANTQLRISMKVGSQENFMFLKSLAVPSLWILSACSWATAASGVNSCEVEGGAGEMFWWEKGALCRDVQVGENAVCMCFL